VPQYSENIRIQELHMLYKDMVTKIAKREHKGAHQATAEDVEQAIWLLICEKVQHLDGYTEKGIADLATKAARTYLLKERIDHMHFMGNFIYTPDIVETYLKDAVWANVEDVPDIDGRVDVRDEFEKLTLPQKQILFRKYGLGESFDRKDSTTRSVADRALVRITNNLNLKANQVKVDDTRV
jgi:hypothetical protein